MGGESISNQDGELVVTVPLLTKLDAMARDQAAGFATIGERLAGKADKADVARLERRLDDHARSIEAHATEIAGLQQQRHDVEVADGVTAQAQQARFTRREKVVGALGILFMSAATIFGPLLAVWATKH